MRSSLTSASIIVVALLTGLAGGVGPALAGCHLIDCVDNVDIKPDEIKQMTCEQLWVLRNSIYDDAGFCFSSDRAAEHFSNQGCSYSDERLVPLNDYQRSNIKVFRDMEAKKGC